MPNLVVSSSMENQLELPKGSNGKRVNTIRKHNRHLMTIICSYDIATEEILWSSTSSLQSGTIDGRLRTEKDGDFS